MGRLSSDVKADRAAGTTGGAAPLDALWQPLTIGPTEVRNRVMANATTLLYGERTMMSDRHIAYYEERARGGTALLVTEQHAVHPLALGAFSACCQAFDQRVVPQFRKLGDAVHRHGAKLFVQLFAPGIADSGTLGIDHWRPLRGASRRPAPNGMEIPVPLDKAEVRELVTGFATSARHVKEGALDGVEIHASHAWLVGQFLSPFWNTRRDEYGGSVENRCRLAVEIAAAIRAATANAITVGIQLSVDEHIGSAGITPEEFEQQLEVLASTGLFDYFNISTGGLHSEHWTIPPMEVEEAFLAPYGIRAKAIAGSRARIFLAGQIRTLASAAEVICSGAADMAAMTRAQLADPFLVRKALEGREGETIACIGENECMLRVASSREVVCMMNPVSGRERSWGVQAWRNSRARVARRVLVIGAGPAGMQCATTAARRGHSVVLLEREDELGGQLRLLRKLPARRRWHEAIRSFAAQLEAAGVTARLGVDGDLATVRSETPDVVICATGSTWDRTGFSPRRPEVDVVEGVERRHVLDVAAAVVCASDDPHSLGDRVVIVDETGDYLPIGLADLLSREGVAVEIVTGDAIVGRHLYGSLDAAVVLPRLAKAGVVSTPLHYLESVGRDHISLVDVWGVRRMRVRADSVVLSMLRSPEQAVPSYLRERYPDLKLVGDCLAPRRITDVIYEGERTGREI